VPHESAFEFCTLTHCFISWLYQGKKIEEKKKKKKAIINKKRSLLKIKLKCRCVIIKGKRCSTTQRGWSQACTRSRAQPRGSWLQAGSQVSQLPAQARERARKPNPGRSYTGEIFSKGHGFLPAAFFRTLRLQAGRGHRLSPAAPLLGLRAGMRRRICSN